MDELKILAALLPQLPAGSDVPVGPGDDCAAIDLGHGGDWLLAAVDQLIGDVHYYRDRTSAERAGAKLLKRNISDIAAMGGVPRWALLTQALGGRDDAWAIDFARGAALAAQRYGATLVGGDLAKLARGVSGEVATLTILGTVPASELIRRSGAQPGDELWVTGAVGNSLASERHLDFEPRVGEGRFLAAGHYASAMLDVSDGVLLDAARLAAASAVALELDPARLPLAPGATRTGALSDGEDYELLFTVPSEKVPALLANWPSQLAPLTRIGRVLTHGTAGKVLAPDGADLQEKQRGGYVH